MGRAPPRPVRHGGRGPGQCGDAQAVTAAELIDRTWLGHQQRLRWLEHAPELPRPRRPGPPALGPGAAPRRPYHLAGSRPIPLCGRKSDASGGHGLRPSDPDPSLRRLGALPPKPPTLRDARVPASLPRQVPKATRPPRPGCSSVGRSTWTRQARSGRGEPCVTEARPPLTGVSPGV